MRTLTMVSAMMTKAARKRHKQRRIWKTRDIESTDGLRLGAHPGWPLVAMVAAVSAWADGAPALRRDLAFPRIGPDFMDMVFSRFEAVRRLNETIWS
ncbi:MAG: hypothetical protein D4R65_07040 [Verrucomicrobiaceae bacterium]|nr:MAG: hypothetical protein D4R65_07040 [Verrucomicrobiaceae bacterium]